MSKEEILRRAYLRAKEDFIPVCGGACAKLLRECCERMQPRRILEVGTAVGYSSSVMATACNAEVDTIELDGERLARARELWKELGIEGRMHAYQGDVKEILPAVIEGKRYGIVFIDGPKSAYKEIFDTVLKNMDENGLIISDDVNYLGLVKGEEYPPHKHRTIVVNMRAYLKHISCVGNTQIFWEDGIAVTEVK